LEKEEEKRKRQEEAERKKAAAMASVVGGRNFVIEKKGDTGTMDKVWFKKNQKSFFLMKKSQIVFNIKKI
jgi:hypothetical protein